MLSFCQFAWPRTCIFVLLILYKFTISTSALSVSYSKPCGSVVPEATPKTYADFTFPYLDMLTSSISGGEKVFGKNSSHASLSSFSFRPLTNIYATNLHGVYKIDTKLTVRVHINNSNMHHLVRNSTHRGRSSRLPRWPDRLVFLLHGFWSESSGKGCFVGSAPWYSNIGEPLSIEPMFMINYSNSSTYSNSFVTGKLESLSLLSDESYFNPISILSFPQVNWYKYKLISEESVKSFYGLDNIENSLVLRSQTREICLLFDRNYYTFNLEYASNCSKSSKNCYPLDGVLKYRPTSVSIYTVQCNKYESKMRFLVHLTNKTDVQMYDRFNVRATLFAEGWWDEKKNSLVIVACKISSSDSFGDAQVGDCSFRLSLYYPSIWSIKNRDKAVGQIWTNKTAQDVGYFGIIKFRTSDVHMKVPVFKYKYTVVEKVNKLCPKKTVTRGERYPSAQSYVMRFEIPVQNSEYFVWSYADPIFIGNKSYADSSNFISNSRWRGYGEIVESEVEFENVVSDNVLLNVSYELSFSNSGVAKMEAGHSSLNTSLNSYGLLVISAEGVYDPSTGYLCMVGCRNLGSNNSLDCDILLNFQFPESIKTEGAFIKGSMQSTRKETDPLFFQNLII